jgi:hypothetical protein
VVPETGQGRIGGEGRRYSGGAIMADMEGPLVEAAKRYLKEQYGEDTMP